MAYNGALLAKARERLYDVRAENEAERLRREQELYKKLPEIKKIDAALRSQMVELMGLALRHGRDISADVAAIERENLALQSERAELLTAAGYPIDYTDEIFSCKLCRDTGMVGAEVCSCLQRLYNAELTRSLGTLLRHGNERFEDFDLELYSGRDREQMRMVRDACVYFAEHFGPHSTNLLFHGEPGLGKTFLSACIARAVAERGFSVAYESAAAALSAFETAKFSRDAEDGETAAERVKQYLSCDLMILDDLGTEMITSFSVSALYQIINGRLLAGKKTIVSTNLTKKELTDKYSAQIMSRLEGEFDFVAFKGQDIRKLKKER